MINAFCVASGGQFIAFWVCELHSVIIHDFVTIMVTGMIYCIPVYCANTIFPLIGLIIRQVIRSYGQRITPMTGVRDPIYNNLSGNFWPQIPTGHPPPLPNQLFTPACGQLLMGQIVRGAVTTHHCPAKQTAVTAHFSSNIYCCLPSKCTVVLRRQTALSAYLKSKHLLLFVYAGHAVQPPRVACLRAMCAQGHIRSI